MTLPSSRQHFSGESLDSAMSDSVRNRLPAWFRLGIASAGFGLLGLLVLARCLEPDPDGLGTHKQLGFPPCGFVVAFGRACPSCGMTTAWSHFARGNLSASISANAGGFMLALVAAPMGIWLLASGIGGTWIWVQPNPVLLIGFAGTTMLATMLQWWLR